MKKYSIANFAVEITRQCNMSCDHCLRGDAQDRNLDVTKLREFLTRIQDIDSLLITGGEPSLHPEIIESVIDEIKAAEINVNSFYIVTNGKVMSDAFMHALINLHMLCSDNEQMSGIALSRDYYHDSIPPENIEKLKVFSAFDETDHDNRNGQRSIIQEGRTAENPERLAEETIRQPRYDKLDEIYEIDDNTWINGYVYMNVFGELFSDVNLSYKSQAAGKCRIGTAATFHEDMQKIIKERKEEQDE